LTRLSGYRGRFEVRCSAALFIKRKKADSMGADIP